MILANGKLLLRLTTSLDLSRLQGTIAKQEVAPQPEAGATIASANDLLDLSALSMRVDRMRQLQDGINMRLARLEDATTTVKHAIVRTRAQLAQRSPAPQRPVMTPPRTALPVQPAQPQSVATPSSPVLWMVIGALLTLLAIVAYVTGRTILQRRTLSNQRSRIDAMLEQARNMATPLLGSEPEFTTAASIADRHVAAVPERPSRTEPPRQPGRDFSEQNESEIDDLTRKAPFTEAGSAFDSTSSPSDEPSYSLRMEMDDAMDNTRSMFSDVDRFITLGRIQNAISLLEFQIKRNSEDRASWIKLMAVYRHQGMDDDFDRTYAAFRDQFGDSLS
ncbi:MAG: hypothetical protein GTO41_08785 [Burkholderiales bacterium]|nr:hypothetical protein [Burkholderiales bacterium]